MKARIERLALGRDTLDAMAFEHVQELALGHVNALEQSFQVLVFLDRFGCDRLLGAFEIVDETDGVLGKAGDRVARGLLLFALGALAQVVEIGVGAQQAVGQVGDLGLQRLDLGRQDGRDIGASAQTDADAGDVVGFGVRFGRRVFRGLGGFGGIGSAVGAMLIGRLVGVAGRLGRIGRLLGIVVVGHHHSAFGRCNRRCCPVRRSAGPCDKPLRSWRAGARF